MPEKNLLVISNNFPNQDNSNHGIFVKEQIKFLQVYFDKIYVFSPVAYGVERLRKTTFQNYHYDNVMVFFPKYFNFPFLYYFGRSVWVFLAVKAIGSLIKKEMITFDLIHAHFTWPSGAIAVEIKNKNNVPLVITEHSSATFHNAVHTNDRYWKNIFKNTDAIIRIRGGDVALFESMDVPKDKIHVIPNGFDAGKFFLMPIIQCRDVLGLPVDKKILLNVGNLYPVKGHKFFIEAISRIVKVRQDILGIIVGSGDLEKQLRELIEELHLSPYIRLVGSKPHAEIPLWMNACDIFVLPSLNEGNPTVLFETLGCGKPFIGTRVGGVPEVIISDEYGLLVQPADSVELAEKILLALNREWDRENILRFAEQFTWEEIARKIREVYSQVSAPDSGYTVKPEKKTS